MAEPAYVQGRFAISFREGTGFWGVLLDMKVVKNQGGEG